MGLTLNKFLNDYFGVEDLKDALSAIGESTSGTKTELVRRLVSQWEPHRRDKYDLLNYLGEDMLIALCEDYNIDSDGDENLLKRRIKKQKLLDNVTSRSNMINNKPVAMKISIEKEPDHKEKKIPDERNTHLVKIAAAICGIIGTVIAVLTYLGLKPH